MNKNSPTLTKAQGEELLRRDLAMTEKAVHALVGPRLNPNQFSATVSLVFNIGSGKIISIGDVAEKIYWFWGKKVPDEVKTAWRGNYLCANLDSVKTHLEWEPKVSLEEGLRIMSIGYGKKL